MKSFTVVTLSLLLAATALPALAQTDNPSVFRRALNAAQERKVDLEARDALIQNVITDRPVSTSTASSIRRAFFGQNPGERLDYLRERWTEHKDWLASTTWRASLPEAAQRAAHNRADALTNVFERILEQLSGIADRIEKRIAFLEEQGLDVSKAKEALSSADVELMQATEAVDTFLKAVANALSSENPRQALQEILPLKETAKLAVREARAALVAVLPLLPEAPKGE